MDIQWNPSPNYREGRKGRVIIAIVNHITAGLMPGTLTWLCNSQAQASSHYLVTKAGVLYQLVDDDCTAWHAGVVKEPYWSLYDGTNPNYYTLGIEHECMAGGELTEAQYQATLWLHQQLCARWGIPVDADHIIGHCKIDTVNRPNDPGLNFPWARLFADLKGENDMAIPAGAKECQIEIGDKTFPGYVLTNRTCFQEGVIVREVLDAMNRQLTWDAANFKAVIK